MIDLESRLWASASQAVRDAGMEFTVPCSRNVRDLIRAGVAVMRRADRVGEADREQAEAHLSRLVGEMIRVTRALGESPAVIRETALVNAKRLCPLWPFG